MPLSVHPSGSKTNFTAPFKTDNNGAAKNTPKKNFNFRAEKVYLFFKHKSVKNQINKLNMLLLGNLCKGKQEIFFVIPYNSDKPFIQVQAPADDWGDDDDFADLDLDNDDFNTAMDAFDNSSPPMEDKNKNEPKISDEELQVGG